jgi:hypothetical protein
VSSPCCVCECLCVRFSFEQFDRFFTSLLPVCHWRPPIIHCTLSFPTVICSWWCRWGGYCLWTAATNGYFVHLPRWYVNMESHGGVMVTGETEELGEKLSYLWVPLSLPQIRRGLKRVRTGASAVQDRRLSAWAVAWPPTVVGFWSIVTDTQEVCNFW